MHENRPSGRIALFIGRLTGGGAERVVVSLANHFASLGIPADLVLVSAVGPYLSLIDPRVNVVDFGADRGIKTVPPLITYMNEIRPRALISSLPIPNIASIVASRFAQYRPVIIVTEHNMVSPWRRSSFKAKLVWHAMKQFYQKADAIVAVSQGVAGDMRDEFGLSERKVHVIYNPVYTPEIAKQAEMEISWPFARPVVLAAGRLVEEKGFDVLLRAFALLREDLDAQLVILGDGPLRGNLQRLADTLRVSSDVAMPGFVSNPYAWMRRADAFAMSSVQEGLPTVLIEAMACGTPVVSTDCPSGPAEILEGGKWGALVPVGDYKALSKAIRNALGSDKRPGAELRARKFSVPTAATTYLSLVEELSGLRK